MVRSRISPRYSGPGLACPNKRSNLRDERSHVAHAQTRLAVGIHFAKQWKRRIRGRDQPVEVACSVERPAARVR